MATLALLADAISKQNFKQDLPPVCDPIRKQEADPLFACFFFWLSRLSVWKERLHPFGEFLRRNLPVRAFVPFSDRLIAPGIEVFFFDLFDLHARGVPLVVFAVDRDCLIIRVARFVVFLCCELLAGLRSALNDAITIVRVVVAFHNEVFAAALALAEAYILLQNLCKLQLQNLFDRAKSISDANESWHTYKKMQIIRFDMKLLCKFFFCFVGVAAFCVVKSLPNILRLHTIRHFLFNSHMVK